MLQEVVNAISQLQSLVVFVGMAGIVWRLVGALDKALERQQALPAEPGAVAPLPAPLPAPGVTNPPGQIVTAKPGTSPVQSGTVADPYAGSHATAPLAPDLVPILTVGFIRFVEKEEGFSSKAFGDFHQYSIGFGTKATSPAEVITEPEGYARMITELSVAARNAMAFLPKNAPVGVIQAMTDGNYNFGTAWQKQPLGALLAQGQYADAKSHLMQYVHAGGEVSDDLVARRKAECDMFDKPL